jgi:hypothetical protein
MTAPIPAWAELSRLVSAERMSTYEQACHGDRDQAARLYTWNIEMTTAFWGGFHVLEVALRNTLHHQLTALAGREDWWNSPQVALHPYDTQKLTATVTNARRDHGPAMLPGHVVAELTLGFWTALLANRYHQRLWVPALSAGVPHLAGTRRDLHRKLEFLRKLRNRGAHHEAIFARHLAADHASLLGIVGAISPDAAAWVEQNTRVPHTLARRADVIAGTATTTF